MTVSELIELLKSQPQDAAVSLSVYGHFYHSVSHRGSHGPMGVIHRQDDGSVCVAEGIRHIKASNNGTASQDGER